MKPIAALVLTLVVAAGCAGDKVAAPSGPKETVSLELCADFRPDWMAIQNEGEAWQQITVPATGPITFDASPRVSVAMALAFFGFGGFTFVVNVTRDELDGTVAFLDCGELSFGDRELNGTVAGVGDGVFAVISAGGMSTTAGSGDNNWSLPDLTNAPVDLVATLVTDFNTQNANQVIVRRGLTPGAPGSAPIPVLNFGAAEAQAAATATLTLANVGSDFLDVLNTFMTANGTRHMMTSEFGSGGTHPIVAVPAAMTTASDLHELSVSASSGDGLRDVVHYYRLSANKSLTLGPVVGVPTITTAATTPARRMRAQVASQPEYPIAVAVTFNQVSICGEGCFTGYVIGVMTSAAFLGGTPATWEVTIPDMSAAGYQAAWGLQNNANPVEWDVMVFGGTADVVLGGTPTEGSTGTSSSRTSGGDFSLGTQLYRQGTATPQLCRSAFNFCPRN